MTSSVQKKRIMSGMSVGAAKKKLLEIYAKAEPGEKFSAKYPGIWPWLETWFRLRSRNETFEAVCQAFAEKVARLHKEKHLLGERIHAQRLELAKRMTELEELKAAALRGESQP